MAEQTPAERPEQWPEVGKQLATGFIDAVVNSDISKVVVNHSTDAAGALLGTVFGLVAEIATVFAKAIEKGEDVAAPALAEMVAAAVSDSFGVDISSSAFAQPRNRGARTATAQTLGRGIMSAIAAGDGEIQPGSSGAERYLGLVLNMALEGWYQGFLFEFATSMWPKLDIGNIESFAELDDTLSQALGLGRLSRRVLGPLVNSTVVTPLEWHTNKTYRPTLLSASETARQVARGRWDREKGVEELARQGFSNDRIEAIFNAQRKFFSAADVRTFVNREHWTRDQGIQHLRDNGYEEQAALDALRLEGLRRIDQLEDAEASAIIAAYADRRIGRAELSGLLSDAVGVASERALLMEIAELRRTLNTKRLSLSQVEAMVKSGVASMLDYREAARRDGYPEEDVILLELQLRYELDKRSDVEELRRLAEAERAAERERRAAAAEERRRQLEAERAAGGRAPLAKFERAAVRGLIPFTQLEAELAAEYAPDDVAVVMALVEADRAAYVAEQERAARAENGARLRGISVGDARAALFAGVLAPADFRVRLGQLGFSDGDADLLTATAVAELEKRQAAERARRDATDTAAARRIDLPRFEMLVRRGARTMTQYDALLAELGFDDVDRAAMIDLLNIKIADDAAARAARERAARELEARGLSLNQIERAVILGVTSIDDYQRFLIEQRFTPDAQVALVALLRARVDEANAARARRQATTAGSGGLELPIATIRRAARLGTIAPDVYAARLERDGYAADDVAIDLELLLLEIADVQAARAKRDAAEQAAAARKLSLSDVEQLVKRELASIEAYRARAAELGYTGDELDLLVDLLVDELDELRAARARRDAIDGELVTRQLSVAQLEDAVKKGLGTIEDFAGELRALGYGAEDAELLTALLVMELETAPPASGG